MTTKISGLPSNHSNPATVRSSASTILSCLCGFRLASECLPAPNRLIALVLAITGLLSGSSGLANDAAAIFTNAIQEPDRVETMLSDRITNDRNPAVDGDHRLASTDLIEPFTIAINDESVADLQRRLRNSRLPDQLEGVSWEYGTELSYLNSLLDYWLNEFDWRKQEAMLNQFDHFKTRLDDTELHFIHQRSANPDAIPLLLVHGWPGSISEFYKIINPLPTPSAMAAMPLTAFMSSRRHFPASVSPAYPLILA